MIHPATPAERFAGIIDTLCQAVARRGGGRDRLAGTLVILIWRHLRQLAARIVALAARIEAGRHRRYPSRRPPRRPAPPRRRAPPVLPHGPAWLVRLVPEAAASGSQLSYLLAEPEMAALLDAAPQMRRLLRPLGRMLGVRLPPPARPAEPAPPAATERATPPDTPDPPPPPAPRLPPPPPRPPPAGPPARAAPDAA